MNYIDPLFFFNIHPHAPTSLLDSSFTFHFNLTPNIKRPNQTKPAHPQLATIDSDIPTGDSQQGLA